MDADGVAWENLTVLQASHWGPHHAGRFRYNGTHEYGNVKMIRIYWTAWSGLNGILLASLHCVIGGRRNPCLGAIPRYPREAGNNRPTGWDSRLANGL